MNDLKDIQLIIESRLPIVVIESHEELRAVDLIKKIAARLRKPVFKWSITEGLRRLDGSFAPQSFNSKPAEVLGNIKAATTPAVYILADFHPYMEDPYLVRLLKDVALNYQQTSTTVVLLSHRINIPPELQKFAARARLSLPDKERLGEIVTEVLREWTRENRKAASVDQKAREMLINNLSGLSAGDARRLARNAVYDDGAVTASDLPGVMKAKYELLSNEGVLSFEHDTARFRDVGGFARLKHWLEQRRVAFSGDGAGAGLDPPKGVMLLGVQGCGKSLAAKAVAGAWGLPLLRLDFGALYNKYHGETERNLRESLQTAKTMAPCVLWIDEVEKGIATSDSDGGTSRRVLGTLLTWLAEKKSTVFIVATANNIEALPPELVRKGRFDEIFFVDLPSLEVRRDIFAIHIRARGMDDKAFDLGLLASAAEGFSGAEIEQAVVSALYSAHADGVAMDSGHILSEIKETRPLAVVMAERIHALRSWAAGRTVPCD